MSGPTLVIELAEALSSAALREFRALMVGLSSHFADKRPGFFDVNVPAERLSVEDRREEDWREPLRFRFSVTPPQTRSSRPWWGSIRSPGLGSALPGLLDGAGCRR
ncbi:DUF6368 family protein [Streptomyces albogriseolus]|uniref:DUF6368 family protein n=1 Tax=Streptomyces albogriseolus TaxID=1887 RepID=UPI003D7451BF